MLADCSTTTNSMGPIHVGANNPLLATLFQVDGSFEVAQWLPLVLYGESGSGKSFIALSIAERWKAEDDDSKPVVTTAADLVRLFQPSQLATKMETETLRFRTTPLLVIDDVHQLADHENASSWLVGVLDYRTQFSLPTIVTTANMTALRQLSKMLFSRLASGLPISLALPDASVRNQIMQDFIQSNRTGSPSPQVINSLIEQTEGMTIIATRNFIRTTFSNHPVAKSTSDDTIDLPTRCMTATAKRFGIRVSDLKGSSRRKNTVLARSIAMFLIREFTSLSLVSTGQRFQDRDHTTVRHACQKIGRLLLSDSYVQDAVRSICTTLNLRYEPRWSVSVDDKCA